MMGRKPHLKLYHRKAEKVWESLHAKSVKVKNDKGYDAFTFDLETTLCITNASCGLTTSASTQCLIILLRYICGTKPLQNMGPIKLVHVFTNT